MVEPTLGLGGARRAELRLAVRQAEVVVAELDTGGGRRVIREGDNAEVVVAEPDTGGEAEGDVGGEQSALQTRYSAGSGAVGCRGTAGFSGLARFRRRTGGTGGGHGVALCTTLLLYFSISLLMYFFTSLLFYYRSTLI